ncbi:MAG TPA: SirB2 family protein [Thiobacillaceae bacterium]|nr:SirB2 family protein [Thiobacillaceae bacterium]
MIDYSLLKHVHVATVVITFVLFVTRGLWMFADSPRLQAKWARILPHVNDTVLLASGIGLAVLLGQYPFVDGWLTAKLLALIAYIALGTFALKRGKTRPVRITAFLLALAVFAYLVAVAISHQVLPWA